MDRPKRSVRSLSNSKLNETRCETATKTRRNIAPKLSTGIQINPSYYLPYAEDSESIDEIMAKFEKVEQILRQHNTSISTPSAPDSSTTSPSPNPALESSTPIPPHSSSSSSSSSSSLSLSSLSSEI